MPSAIIIKKIPGKPGKVYYPLEKITIPTPQPSEEQTTVTILAASLNHRDLFIRQHLYPSISFSTPLLADAVALVSHTGSSPKAKTWLRKRVLLNPGTGWASDPLGPEHVKGYAIMGGTSVNPLGTLCETLAIDSAELEECPPHLSDAEAAALPLTGLTAWRALVTKSGAAHPDHNILVTGIGGGVAIMALLFAVAKGTNVYVTSSSEAKITRAVTELGARGGILYTTPNWEKTLLARLPKERPRFDAILDGAGGDILSKATKLLKAGGVVVSYGMTVAPSTALPMAAVLRNIEVRGSTMGSREEFRDMVAFVREKRIRPVVERVVKRLEVEGVDGLFEDMRAGKQFGKLVVEMGHRGRENSKL